MAGELELAQNHIDEINEIALEYLKGKDATRIAKELGLTRVKVADAIKEWQIMASNSQAVRDRARDALAGADFHFTSLIGKSYGVMEEAKIQGNLSMELNAIKLVKDIEAQRIDLLQRAGLLDNRELADSVVEMEKKYEAMKGILNNILCPECRLKVLRELQTFSTEAVVINAS